MKNLILTVLTLLTTACSTLPNSKSPITAYIDAGNTTLDKADSSSEQTITVGVTYKQEPDSSEQNVTRGWVSDLSLSYGSGEHSTETIIFASGLEQVGVEFETERLALNLGLRYYFDTGTKWIQPYLGLGASPQVLRVQTSLGEDETDFAFAGYGAFGLEAPVGDHGRLGVVYRHTAGASFDLGDEENLNFNAGTLALTLGWSF